MINNEILNDPSRKFVVYAHVLPKQVSGYNWDKYYIGITSKNPPSKRWENGFGYRGKNGNSYFFKAISKYGWDNFRHIILKKGLSYKEACIWEKAYIASYLSNNAHYGYNLTSGGEGVRDCVVSDETKKKMSEAHSGEKNHFYGRHHTEETKILMSKNHADVNGKNNPRKRAVRQFTLEGEFVKEYYSIQNAADAFETNWQSIYHCVSGRVKTSHGFLWRYIEDTYEENNNYYILNDPYIRKRRKAV